MADSNPSTLEDSIETVSMLSPEDEEYYEPTMLNNDEIHADLDDFRGL